MTLIATTLEDGYGTAIHAIQRQIQVQEQLIEAMQLPQHSETFQEIHTKILEPEQCIHTLRTLAKTQRIKKLLGEALR